MVLSPSDASVKDEELGIGVVPRRWAMGEDAFRWCKLTIAACEVDCDLDELGDSVYATTSLPSLAVVLVLIDKHYLRVGGSLSIRILRRTKICLNVTT
jgi:hypothetical protein